MLEYVRINMSEGIDANKTKEWCNDCHYLMQKAMSFNICQRK